MDELQRVAGLCLEDGGQDEEGMFDMDGPSTEAVGSGAGSSAAAAAAAAPEPPWPEASGPCSSSSAAAARRRSSDGVSEDGSPDDMTCAICLERTPLTDVALVKGCEHQYCVHCILQWSLCKEWCPQCKAPFDYLLTHRQLDGTLTDYLAEESVVLLKRARWFDDHMRAKEKGKALMPASASSRGAAPAEDEEGGQGAADWWADYYEDCLDAELEEEELEESFYFSSAAGRARVVLGNRRWGEGGYMRAGRMYARPVTHTARTPNAGGKGSKGAGSSKAAAATAAAPAPAAAKAPQPAGSSGSSSSAAAARDSGGSSSSCATTITTSAAAAAAAAGGSGSASLSAAAPASGAAAGASGGRGRAAASPPWLAEDYGDGDDSDDDGCCFDGGDGLGRSFGSCHGGGGGGGGRRGHSGSRPRGRPDRPPGMVKPLRQVPKNSPVCPLSAGPLVSPLGKSPGGGGFTVGSWGASSAGGGPPAPSGGSTPGSGRRAKRNARRAAADASGVAAGDWD